MKITYELVPDDLTYYSKESAKETSLYTVQASMWSVLILLFIMADLLMSVVGAFLNDGSIRLDPLNLLLRGVVAVVLLGIAYFGLMAVSKYSFRKLGDTPGKNGVFCEHTIELDDSGFTETTSVNRSFQSWEGVDKITETKSFVILHIRLGAGYLIPKRAFSCRKEIEQFIPTVQGHLDRVSTPGL